MPVQVKPRRQSTAKQPSMMRATYPKDGRIEELRGVEIEVPYEVIDKRGWIERRFEEEVAAAESQKAKRDKQRAVDSEAKQSLSAEVAALQAQVGNLQETIAGLNNAEAIQISTNASESVKTMMGVYNELKVLKESVEADRVAAQALRDEAAQIKEETIAHQAQAKKIHRNFLAMMNERQEAANAQTERAQQQAEEAQARSRELLDQLSFGNGLIEDARNFRAENGELIAAMTAETVEKQMFSNQVDFVAFANLVLHAAGIDRTRWEDTLAELRTNPEAVHYNLTRDLISQHSEEFRLAAGTRSDEEIKAQQTELEKLNDELYPPNPDTVLPHPEIKEEVEDIMSLVENTPEQQAKQQALRERIELMPAPVWPEEGGQISG